MRVWGKIILFGVGVWGIPFLSGMMLFALQQKQPELFDTLMAVSVSLASVLFGVLYFRKQNSNSLRSALLLGFGWMMICLLIDFPLFVFGFGMEAWTYLADIGLTYLIVPISVFGLAYISVKSIERPR